jgi:uncharacterized protein with NRDE domain
MCTLTLWWRQIEGAPVVIAANRDENPRRAWEDPHPWNDQPIFAGRDLVGQGTWLGLNARGVLCGVTNLWGGAVDPTRLSRGQIVVDALRQGSARQAAEGLRALPAGRTNGFAMLCVDRDAAFRVDGGDSETVVTPLLPGITVLANWRLDEKWPRSERALALASAVPRQSFEDARPAIERMLGDHDGAAIRGQPICGHGEDYATVCATVIALDDRGGVRWRDARGNPCTAPFLDRSV